ncbi:tetratricopeptide repeat protein [Streptomyces sp. NPDC097619]|uniref:tetratricopeptide repeat protein n=1 Tax=Streptomyces sp. NPDC097619 TaxID=3157228 RepID=UPI003332EECF
MRDVHRGEVDRLVVRAVEEEVRRSGGRVEQGQLLARARTALDAIAAGGQTEYEAWTRALDEAAASEQSLGEAFRRGNTATAALVTAVAAVAATGTDLAFGLDTGSALAAGAVVAAAGAAATVLKVTATHWPAAHRRAGELGRPGGSEQLRLQWLSAVEVRGIRPFLDEQRAVASARPERRSGPAESAKAAPRLRGTDRSAAALRRSALEQSFGRLPEPAGPFAGRRTELNRIAQWVQAARASTETRPVVVVLHGEPGSGRTSLAVRAAHGLRDQYRGACVVDLRGGSLSGDAPLPTREALLHLLNRLGAPREQLLFRERTSPQQQVRRLSELYLQHLRGLPVTVVLDDAVDAEQVRLLVPERSDSLVLVTAREPLTLPADMAAWVHQLPVTPLPEAEAEAVLRAAVPAGGGAGAHGGAGGAHGGATDSTGGRYGDRADGLADDRDGGVYDGRALAAVVRFTGGLPLALRLTGPLLGTHTARDFEGHLVTAPGTAGSTGPDPRESAGPRGIAGAEGSPGAVPAAVTERVLELSYAHQSEAGRRLLRRLSLAGRVSVGGAAAAALSEDGDAEALRLLGELARAGLVDHVRGQRYRLHDSVRAFAAVKLRAEEDVAAITAAQERLIRTYARLADAVIRMVDGKTSTRADHFGDHGFPSLDAALRWLDEESSFITATLRHAQGVDQRAVLDLLGALCDHCLLRGDLYRLGEINELARAVDQGLLTRSVQWRTGIAARQLGDLDTARSTLTSVVDSYREAQHGAGTARALCSLGITLHHQGQLAEAAAKLREAAELQSVPELAADLAWTRHALAAVERDRARLAEAAELLAAALAGHRESESLHGQGWAHFQLGQVYVRRGDTAGAETELRRALELAGRTRDGRAEAWALTELARTRLVAGDPAPAVEGLVTALARHREAEDARGEAWTLYYLGQALEEGGDPDRAVRELERARTMFSRMRDVYGLACARHHSGRLTRDLRAAQTGGLRNSGFARQLLADARADFRRIGLAHGEAWTCLELAVVDAGNARLGQALGLCEEAAELFASYGDARGGDWARFLRCTLLPYTARESGEGAARAREELAALAAAAHPARDGALADALDAYRVALDRGVDPGAGWQAWRLGLTPNRHSREVMGVPA